MRLYGEIFPSLSEGIIDLTGAQTMLYLWFVRLYGEIFPSLSEGIIDLTGAQTMLYLTCITISSVNLAQYGVSTAKDWVFVECGGRTSER